jgi:hypothetical protein
MARNQAEMRAPREADLRFSPQTDGEAAYWAGRANRLLGACNGLKDVLRCIPAVAWELSLPLSITSIAHFGSAHRGGSPTLRRRSLRGWKRYSQT